MGIVERVLPYLLTLLTVIVVLSYALYGKVRSYKHLASFRQQMRQGDYDGALETIKQAININGRDGYYYLQRAQAHVKLRDYQAALDDYNLALRHARSGDEATAYAGRAGVQCCLEKYDLALIDANHAIACNRHAWYAYVARGHTYLGLEHAEIALDDFEQAHQLAVETKAPVSFGLALAHYKLKQYAQGLKWAHEAVGLDPENAEVCALLGGILIGCGRLEEAAVWLEKARTFDPQLARIYFYLAQLRLSTSSPTEATANLLKCVKMEQPQIERLEAQKLLTSVLRR